MLRIKNLITPAIVTISALTSAAIYSTTHQRKNDELPLDTKLRLAEILSEQNIGCDTIVKTDNAQQTAFDILNSHTPNIPLITALVDGRFKRGKKQYDAKCPVVASKTVTLSADDLRI